MFDLLIGFSSGLERITQQPDMQGRSGINRQRCGRTRCSELNSAIGLGQNTKA
jgi:hypothetical protein